MLFFHFSMLFFLIQKHHSLWRITFNCSHNRMWYIKLFQICHISFCQFDPKCISCLIQILYFCSSNDWRRYSLCPLPCQCDMRHFTLIFFCKCSYTFHDFYCKKLMPSSSACFSKTHTSHAKYRNFKITVLNYSLISIRTPAQGETTTVLITMVFQSTHESTKPKS